MWTVTHGYPPSQEALMQFVIAKSTPSVPGVGGLGLSNYSTTEQAWSGQGQGWVGEGAGGQAWSGKGVARFPRGGGRGGGGYRYGDTHDHQNWDYGAQTDAIVLGGDGSATSDETMTGPTSSSDQQQQQQQQMNVQMQGRTVGAGGRMQRVGDRWVFVRDTPSSIA